MGLQDRDWYQNALAEKEKKYSNNNELVSDFKKLTYKQPGRKKRNVNLFDVLISLTVLTAFLIWIKKAGIV